MLVWATAQVVAVDDSVAFLDQLQIDGVIAYIDFSNGATVAIGVYGAERNVSATGEKVAESCGRFLTHRCCGFRGIDAGHADGDVGSVLAHGEGVAVAYGDDVGRGAIGWGGWLSGAGVCWGW